MNELTLLIDCLQRLNRRDLTYYLTGSMASNFWGIPRTTHDLDFVVHIGSSQVKALVDEFTGDFYIDEAAVRSAFAPPYQFNAIDTRSAIKVDFWLSRPAPFDQEMLRRRVRQSIGTTPAWIATAEDVILHKLIWNRITPSDRQLRDAAGVSAVQGAALDVDYMRGWAEELGLSEDLEKILSGAIRPKTT